MNSWKRSKLEKLLRPGTTNSKLPISLRWKFLGLFRQFWPRRMPKNWCVNIQAILTLCQKTLKTAGTLTCFLFKNHVTSSLETIIDEGKEVKHSEFAQKIEKIFEDPSKINKKVKHLHCRWHSQLTPDVVESCYPPIIQSGGKYDFKIGVEPDDNVIHFGTIVCSIGMWSPVVLVNFMQELVSNRIATISLVPILWIQPKNKRRTTVSWWKFTQCY